MPPKLTKAQRVWLNQNASKANACLKIERIGLEFAVMPPCFQEHATALESHRRHEPVHESLLPVTRPAARFEVSTKGRASAAAGHVGLLLRA